MTDGSGNEVNSYDYDPYGQTINQVEQTGLNNPWKFAGGYLDSSTNLYKFGTRYYDPSVGRWTQQDPVGGSLGDLNSANRYVYAGDDPVNAVDPNGTCSSVTTILTYLSGLVGVVGVAYLIAQLETITFLLIITNPPIVLAILATLLTLGLFVDCLYE